MVIDCSLPSGHSEKEKVVEVAGEELTKIQGIHAETEAKRNAPKEKTVEERLAELEATIQQKEKL